jgi:hypothetical protein
MTSDLDSGGESPIELRRRRIFRVRLWIGTGGYLLASFALYQWGQGTSPWRIIWAVLPLLFFAWNVIVIVLRMRQLDEYQIKLLFPPLAVGFTVAMFAAITLGTLNAAGFAVPNAGWPVALIGMVTWGCTTLATRGPKA